MEGTRQFWEKTPPVIVGIAGGSGSGKTWLSSQLAERFRKQSGRISLDDFYRNRSHMPVVARDNINFDHPRSIDWPLVEHTLSKCIRGEAAFIPIYDFAVHSRTGKTVRFTPKPLILIDGLWLYRRPSMRRLIDLKIYLECPADVRLERRIERDCRERGRCAESVRTQFAKAVAPMHECFVEPQKRWADCILKNPPEKAEVGSLVETIGAYLNAKRPYARS